MSELDLDLEEEEKLEEKLEEEETGQKEEEEGHALDAETGQTNQASTSRETGTSHDNSKGRETGTKGSITNDAMCENENQNTTTEREMAQLQFILDCSSGLLEKVEKALHEDALIEIDVNSLDDQGTPALNYAVMLGHVEICKVLLDKGALPTVKDKKGRDARKWASRSSNQEIKDLVLLNGSYSAHSTPVSSRPNSLLPLEPVSATTTATTTTAATDPTAITITNTTKRQKEQPPTIPSSTIKTITSSPQRSLSIAAETTDSFDWNQGKPSEMCPFDPDDSAHILNVAIRTIVPSRKSKFQPLGANVLFLCARYLHASPSNSENVPSETKVSEADNRPITNRQQLNTSAKLQKNIYKYAAAVRYLCKKQKNQRPSRLVKSSSNQTQHIDGTDMHVIIPL